MMKAFKLLSTFIIVNAHTWAASNEQPPLDMTMDDTMWEQTFGRVGQMLEDHLLAKVKEEGRRSLQVDGPVFTKPKRYCGDEINFATVDELKVAATSFINAIFPPDTAAALNTAALGLILPSMKYGLVAQVICGSCAGVRRGYRNHDFIRASGENSFRSYCGPGRHGYRHTHSALMLEPLQPGTTDQVQGVVKQYVHTRSLSIGQQDVPTETWPDDLNSFTSATAILDHFHVWIPMIIASTGVVAIAPDYTGYGQSFYNPKLTINRRLYQQATVVSYLTSKLIVEYPGDTVFSDELSAAGYSEGGYAVVPAANALSALGLKILNVHAGGAPFRLGGQVSRIIQGLDAGTGSSLSKILVAFTGSAYSSLNGDLPNSNVGQDLLSTKWQIRGNYTRNVQAWLRSDQSAETMLQLLPTDALEILHEGFVSRVRAEIAAGTSDDACANPVDGVDNLLCETIKENTVIIDEVESTTFPIVSCHSPNDETIAVLNAPDVAQNPLLSTASIQGITATGTHLETQFFCHIATLLEYTSIGTLGLNTILPIEDEDEK